MLDIDEINNTIAELESGTTTFDTCIKLASLYTVKQHLEDAGDEVILEYEDILPQYKAYVDIKRKFQSGEVTETLVEKHVRLVCKEIAEFIQSIYSSTDMPVEREYIKNMVNSLQNM